MNENHDYADGLRDGEIRAIKQMQASQNLRLDNHAKRLATLERVAWALFGIIAMIEFGPRLQAFFG